MADLALEFDATGSNIDGSTPGTPLALTRNAGWSITAYDAPAPELKANWAGGADTNGEVRADSSAYNNRTITVEVLQQATTAAALQSALNDLRTKLGKLNEEGGTLKVTFPSAAIRFYDIRAVTHSTTYEPIYVVRNYIRLQLSITAAPFSRGIEQDLGDSVETTLPYLEFVKTSVAGEVPALGRLVIDNDSATNQAWVTWGVQSQRYDSASSAALFYQAGQLTPMSGASVAAGAVNPLSSYRVTATATSTFGNTLLTGVSPTAGWTTGMYVIGPNLGSSSTLTSIAGSNFTLSGAANASGTAAIYGGAGVVRCFPITLPQAFLSTQLVSGTHLKHVGTFRVFARLRSVATNTGTIYAALHWTQGDFAAPTVNAAVTVTPFAASLQDLGLVTLKPVISGTQRWEGRIILWTTRSTYGNAVDIDYLMIVPVDEGSGTVRAVTRAVVPASYTWLDQFDQSPGALAGQAPQIGTGTYSTAGDPDDYQIIASGDGSGNPVIRRNPAAGDSDWHVEIAGSATYTNMTVTLWEWSASYYKVGTPSSINWSNAAVARYVDISNFFMAMVQSDVDAGTKTLYVQKRVSATSTVIATHDAGPITGSSKIALTVNTDGSWLVRHQQQWKANGSTITLQGFDTDLVSGSGFLGTGKAAIAGHQAVRGYLSGSNSVWQEIDKFSVATAPTDAAVYANQSVEIRHDGVRQEDSGGTFWKPPSSYVGDYLTIPEAGAEGRSTRMLVKATQGDPSLTDPAIDDVSARLFITPRYLT